MIGFVRSELLRARSRRLVWVLLIASVLGIVVGNVIAVATSNEPSPDTVARAERQYERDLEACRAGEFSAPADELPPGYDSLDAFCEDVVVIENYLPSEQIRRADLPSILEGSALVVVLLGVVIGASLAGADWSSGTMTTILTWEPRRARVLVVRTLVAVAVVVVIAIALQVVFSVAWLLSTAIAGTTETDASFAGDTLGPLVRIAGVTGVFAAVALAVATIGRSTVAGVGILFGYLVVIEGFVAGLWDALPPWLIVRAATVVVSETPLVDQAATATYGPDGQLLEAGGAGVLLGVGEAWLLLAAYAVVLVGAAIALFRVRDVS